MTYTYYSLSNEILRSVNEVVFSNTSEFDSATGIHQHVKESINDVISDIYSREESKWSFQLTDTSQLLTIGEEKYNAPANSYIDWDSFYIDKVYGDADDFGSVTCTTDTFTITSGSFTDAGFAVGMKVRWQGLTANTDSDVTIVAVTDTTMQVSETLTAISTPDTVFSVTNAYDTPDSVKLYEMDIDTYRNLGLTDTKNTKETTDYVKPSYVVRGRDNNITFGERKPDATYLVRYQYWAGFTELSASTDVPDIPQRFKKTIKYGVLRNIYMFWDNVEMSSYYGKRFEDSVEEMRNELIKIDLSASYLF